MHKLGVRCELIQEGGYMTDSAVDKRMDFHFNAVLDAVSEWRKDQSQCQDLPLGGERLLSLSDPSHTVLDGFRGLGRCCCDQQGVLNGEIIL